MSMDYIRRTYGVPVKRGMRVRVKGFDGWTDGRITSATHYVMVAPDKWPNSRIRCHPTDESVIQYPEVSPTTGDDKDE